MTIFSRTAKDQYDNSFRIDILLPFIGRQQFPDVFFDDRYTKYAIELNSEISYTYTDFFWCFIFRILGFGFTIQRQNGY